MSTPTTQFAQLSIEFDDTPMPPTEDEKRRAYVARDVLCSVSGALPMEFEAHTFKTIIERRGHPQNPEASWTISGKLPASVLLWAAYDEQWFSNVCRMHSPAERAITFAQTLERRFSTTFDEYDQLKGSDSTPDLIRDQFRRIVRKLRNLSREIYEDRQNLRVYEAAEDRLFRENAILGVTLNVLGSLCKRTEAIVPGEILRRSSRRTTSQGEPATSLFAVMIRQAVSDAATANEVFLLSALDLFSGAALGKRLDNLVAVSGLLDKYAAGDEYIRRFDALQQKVNEESEGQSGPSGGRGASGRNRGRQIEPENEPVAEATLGSKRTQHTTIQSTPKRGRKG